MSQPVLIAFVDLANTFEWSISSLAILDAHPFSVYHPSHAFIWPWGDGYICMSVRPAHRMAWSVLREHSQHDQKVRSSSRLVLRKHTVSKTMDRKYGYCTNIIDESRDVSSIWHEDNLVFALIRITGRHSRSKWVGLYGNRSRSSGSCHRQYCYTIWGSSYK